LAISRLNIFKPSPVLSAYQIGYCVAKISECYIIDRSGHRHSCTGIDVLK